MHKEITEFEAIIDPKTLPAPKRKHPTLVVCTKSLLEQWKEEAINRTRPNTFKVCIHHGMDSPHKLRVVTIFKGPGRTKSHKELYQYDLVISSYAIISSEFSPQRKV